MNDKIIRDKLAELDKKLSLLSNAIESLQEYLKVTREISILRSQSLPILMYQYKTQVATEKALRETIFQLEREAAERLSSFEEAVRLLERERVIAREYRRNFDELLKINESLRDENRMLKEKIERLEQENNALKLRIKALAGFESLIKDLIAQRKLPSEVLVEARKYVRETKIE